MSTPSDYTKKRWSTVYVVGKWVDQEEIGNVITEFEQHGLSATFQSQYTYTEVADQFRYKKPVHTVMPNWDINRIAKFITRYTLHRRIILLKK